MQTALETPPLTVSLVDSKHRLGFLPHNFGSKHMLSFEQAIYLNMRELCDTYDGGFWDYLETSNGAAYMRPTGSDFYDVCVFGNSFEGNLSADAVGIVVTLFALSTLFAHGVTDDHLIDLYHLLRDFAGEHKEVGSIFRAID